jgi:hypothetical protein
MTDKAISPLRQRMIEDLTIRKLAPKTHMTTCSGSRTSPPSSAACPIQRARSLDLSARSERTSPMTSIPFTAPA